MADQSKPITDGWEPPVPPIKIRSQGESIEKDKMPKEARDEYLRCQQVAHEKAQQLSKPISELTVKVNIDCSDVLKGLKEVQRGERKAAQALKELENVKGGIITGCINVNDMKCGELDIEKLEKSLYEANQKVRRTNGLN